MDYLTGAELEIVISAENNVYCAWQCLLAHYSCSKNLKITPLVVIHGDPYQPLHRHFLTLIENGGRTQRALNYRGIGVGDYPPRNTAATLLKVKTSAPYIMLCDPDFLFLGPIPRDALPANDNQITFDYIGFMQVTSNSKKDLLEPAHRADVELDQLNKKASGGAVPHIVPTSIAKTLAADWLKCIEFFAESKDPILWVASMWALVFSVQRLGLQWSMTKLAITDAGQEAMIDLDIQAAPQILHYAYGNQHFSKRDFAYSDVSLMSSVWGVRAPTGSMSGFICDYLSEVKQSYGIRYSWRQRILGHRSNFTARRVINALRNRLKRLLVWLRVGRS